jgi:CelD/BcsL family acetyltransferase involved in cellulose biosynthesis
VDAFTLEPVAAIDEVRVEWEALARAAENVFATPDWVEAWLAHVPLDVAPRVFAARVPEGRLAAVVPLGVVRGRYVRKGRLLGFGPANELGPVVAPADAALGRQALVEALAATRSEWDIFVGDKLPGEGWGASLGGTVVRSEPSPVVEGRWESWDRYLATRSTSFRQELRRKERRLLERGARYRSIDDAGELGPALDALFELHRARWGDAASPWFAGVEAFHRRFAEIAFARGWLCLHVVELDERPAALYHGFRFGNSEWSYQFGRDPIAERASIGVLIAAHAIREALAAGVERFRLGPGRQDYKRRFATGEGLVETAAVAHGVRGRAALAAAKRRSG